jgi:hypothetical protein
LIYQDKEVLSTIDGYIRNAFPSPDRIPYISLYLPI